MTIFNYDGVEYKNFAECCRKLGLSNVNVGSYARSHNISKQEAITFYLENNGKYPNRKPFSFNGTEYRCFSECCEELGFPVSTIKMYAIQTNVSLQASLEHHLKNRRPRTTFTYKGVDYKNFSTCCKELGIDYRTIANYAKNHNLSREESLDIHFGSESGKLIARKREEFIYDGKVYKSFSECCRELKLNKSDISKCSKYNNISKQEAIRAFLDKREARKNKNLSQETKKQSFCYNGVVYKTFREFCREFGLSAKLVETHCYVCCISKEDAVNFFLNNNIKTNPKSKGFEYEGVTYSSFSECCRKFGLVPGHIAEIARYHNVSKQEGIRRSLNNELRSATIEGVYFNGMYYESLKDCCDKLGINYGAVNSHYKYHNISKQEAIQKYLDKKTEGK